MPKVLTAEGGAPVWVRWAIGISLVPVGTFVIWVGLSISAINASSFTAEEGMELELKILEKDAEIIRLINDHGHPGTEQRAEFLEGWLERVEIQLNEVLKELRAGQ